MSLDVSGEHAASSGRSPEFLSPQEAVSKYNLVGVDTEGRVFVSSVLRTWYSNVVVIGQDSRSEMGETLLGKGNRFMVADPTRDRATVVDIRHTPGRMANGALLRYEIDNLFTGHPHVEAHKAALDFDEELAFEVPRFGYLKACKLYMWVAGRSLPNAEVAGLWHNNRFDKEQQREFASAYKVSEALRIYYATQAA